VLLGRVRPGAFSRFDVAKPFAAAHLSAQGDVDALFCTAVDREIRRLKNESFPRNVEVQALCKPGDGKI
jgi:hypothetical protein